MPLYSISKSCVGLDGEPFNIIKFRSMRLDAEKHGAQMASENDNRITKVGQYLRKIPYRRVTANLECITW